MDIFGGIAEKTWALKNSTNIFFFLTQLIFMQLKFILNFSRFGYWIYTC